MVLVFEHLLCVVVKHGVIDVHQAVLHELHLGDAFSEGLYLLFLHVDVILLHQLVFREVPFQLVEHLVEVFVELLLSHLLVGSEYPAFEEVLREGDLLHLLHDGGLHVQTKAVFALLGEGTNDVLFDASAETFLIFRSVCTINFCEQLSIYGAGFHLCLGAFLFVLGDVLAETVGVGLYLLVDHLFGRLDGVLRQFVLAVELSVELRRYGDVEEESEGVLVVEVDLRRLLARQRIAENLDLVVLNVLLEVLSHEFVQDISEDALAVHFLHQSGRNHTRTEARHLSLVAYFFQLFSYFFLIVSRLDSEGYYCLQVFQFRLINLHKY